MKPSAYLQHLSENTPPLSRDGQSTQALTINLVSRFLLACGVFSSGFVLFEPSPYEVIMLALISLWMISGLRFSRTVMVLLALFTLFNLGGLLSVAQMADLKKAPLYIAISYFLALCAVFFAAVIESDWRYLKSIFNGYLCAALLTGLLGILGYLQLIPGAELFTLYGRAKGAFQDPNVFAPFLILPLTWCIYCVLTRKLRDGLFYWLALLILTLAVFLSFSRAAWGMLAMVLLLLPALLYIRSRNQRFRLKLIILSLCAIIAIALAIMLALQIPDIAQLFSERARLEQDYDSAHNGRFARHWQGLLLATEHPLGIGPLEFGPLFGEDTHNIWLKALLDYGWTGFVAFMIMTILTLALGIKLMFRDRPWQPYLLCTFLAYLAHVVIGNVIDTDHWRHFYLLIGIIWGCAALEYKYQKQRNETARVALSL